MNEKEGGVLAGIERRFKVISTRPSESIPGTLYHYTTATGFLGIVSGGTLRASSFRYLNDATEIDYGATLIRGLLQPHVTGGATEASRRTALTVLNALVLLQESLEFFLTCWCEEPDRLSQWRAYGASTGRFCIGFEAEDLPPAVLPYRLARVIYDRPAQESRANSDIKAVLDAVEALEGEDGVPSDDFILETSRALTYRLLKRACVFKHPGFSEENETRAVYEAHDSPAPDAVKFDTTAGVLRPYVDLIVGGPPLKRLPITEVIVGPGALQAQQAHVAELVLLKYGYKDVAVRGSAVPFRDG